MSDSIEQKSDDSVIDTRAVSLLDMTDNELTDVSTVTSNAELVNDGAGAKGDTEMNSSDMVAEDDAVGLADPTEKEQGNSYDSLPENGSKCVAAETDGETKNDEIV